MALNNTDLGRYHIIEQLGEGGMGAVYKAFDARLERHVAIKVIIPSQHQSEQFSKRFEREAKALAKLTHPNIVPVIDYGEQDGMLYLVMAFISGGTLRDRMSSPLAWQQSARFLAPVAGALGYAHQHGIIHRDVKPANILVMESGQPMLSDFGIAKIMEGQQTQLTGTGVGLGTPDYMAPEQGFGSPVDARSDVYSLGVVYYEMVTGRKPFHADTPLAVLIKHMTEPLPRPRDFVADLPDAVEQVIFKAMAKKPEDRYQDMGAFQSALENLAFNAPGVHPEAAQAQPTVQNADAPPQTQTMPAQAQTLPREVSPAPFILPAAPLPASTVPMQVVKPPAAAAKRRFPAWLLLVGGAGFLGFLALAGAGLIYLFSNLPGTATPEPVSTSTGVLAEAERATSTSVQETPAKEASPTAADASLSSDPDRLVVYLEWAPVTLDPAFAAYGLETIFTFNVYESLVFQRVTDTQEFLPQLAESWEISADGLTYTFKIRPGVTFHEGGSLTAEDVAYTFRRSILLGNDISFLFPPRLLGQGEITYLVDDTGALYGAPDQLWQADPAVLRQACETVENAVSFNEADQTVTFQLVQPDYSFLSILASPSGVILDKEWSAQQGAWDGNCDSWQYYYAPAAEDTALLEKANGTGPFRFVRWDHETNTVTLERNESYWRQEPAWEGAPVGAPAIQSVELRGFTEPAPVESALQSGELDLILLQQAVFAVPVMDLQGWVGEECLFNLESSAFDCSTLGNQPLREYSQLPSPNFYALFFTFDIQDPGDGSAFMGSGQLDGSGIPPDFFNDINIRRGFSACVDSQTIIHEVEEGNGYQSYGYSTIGMEGYDPNRVVPAFSLEECASQLSNSSFTGLWETGFWFQAPTRAGSTYRILTLQNLAQNLRQVNDRFVMEVLELDASQFSNYNRSRGQMPLSVNAWWADYYDSANMYSMFGGWSSERQNLQEEFSNNINALAGQALREEDANVRSQIYRSLAAYLNDNALVRPVGMTTSRMYAQTWVRGFEYNPALASLYLYPISEQ
jgi:peptide/nickel transport system substrate-binding protein